MGVEWIMIVNRLGGLGGMEPSTHRTEEKNNKVQNNPLLNMNAGLEKRRANLELETAT